MSLPAQPIKDVGHSVTQALEAKLKKLLFGAHTEELNSLRRKNSATLTVISPVQSCISDQNMSSGMTEINLLPYVRGQRTELLDIG